MDNFIIGDNSKLAYEACFAVVDAITKGTNLLTILCLFMETGLGKTHLMQAVGNEILNRKRR